MTTFIESLATTVLLIFLVLFLVHLLNGTGTDWLTSKWKAAPS